MIDHHHAVVAGTVASPPAVAQCERWARMRTLLSILMLCMVAAGCTTVPRDLHAVWTETTPPPADLAAPGGFAITPSKAYSVVFDSRALSLKHVWQIYADSHYYYVHDTFLGDSRHRAFAQGVRIDGQTGEVVRR
jgi:hypothetical protein